MSRELAPAQTPVLDSLVCAKPRGVHWHRGRLLEGGWSRVEPSSMMDGSRRNSSILDDEVRVDGGVSSSCQLPSEGAMSKTRGRWEVRIKRKVLDVSRVQYTFCIGPQSWFSPGDFFRRHLFFTLNHCPPPLRVHTNGGYLPYDRTARPTLEAPAAPTPAVAAKPVGKAVTTVAQRQSSLSSRQRRLARLD